jgi:hypothetical protein
VGDFHVGSKLSSFVPFKLNCSHSNKPFNKSSAATHVKKTGLMMAMLDGGLAAVTPVDELVTRERERERLACFPLDLAILCCIAHNIYMYISISLLFPSTIQFSHI